MERMQQHPGAVAVAPDEVRDGVDAGIGRTPIVRLRRVVEPGMAEVWVKTEGMNPGGSIKDRTALGMILDAERRGLLKPGDVIVEPTSGNTGIGLAQVAAARGYRLILCLPSSMSEERKRTLLAYGAELVLTDPERRMLAAIEEAERIRDRLGAWMPNQFTNPANPRIHYETTGPELWEQMEGRLDAFVYGSGTGGTISGVGRYLKEQNPNVIIVGADPEGSLYTQDVARPYKVEGIGEDFMPGTMDMDVVDQWVTVSDRDSFELARRITREEGILVGGSTGTAMYAAIEVAKRMAEGQNIVVIFPDTGRGYLSKVFNDAWLRENGFLDRLPIQARVRELVYRQAREMPSLVTGPAPAARSAAAPRRLLSHQASRASGSTAAPVISSESRQPAPMSSPVRSASGMARPDATAPAPPSRADYTPIINGTRSGKSRLTTAGAARCRWRGPRR